MSRVRTALGLGLALCLVFIFSCVETKEDVIKNPPPAQKKPSPPPTSTHPAPVNNGNHSNVNHPNGASGKGVWHTVEPGQTLWRICKAYGVDMEQVARANGIHDPTAISTGQKIFIPGATRLMGVDPYQPPAGTTVDQPKPQPPVIEKPEEPDVFEPETGTYTSGKLLWPLPEGVGIIFSPFGTRKNYFHEGVDLDIGSALGVIEKSGTWYSYSDARIGQGKENAKEYLKQHPEIAAEVEQKILTHYGLNKE